MTKPTPPEHSPSCASTEESTGLAGWIDQRLPIISGFKAEYIHFRMPKNLNGLWNFGAILTIVLLLMLAVLAWSLFQTTAIGKTAKAEDIASFAACLSVLGLVSFSYYANRSAWMNLEICLPEALLCLCFPLQSMYHNL